MAPPKPITSADTAVAPVVAAPVATETVAPTVVSPSAADDALRLENDRLRAELARVREAGLIDPASAVLTDAQRREEEALVRQRLDRIEVRQTYFEQQEDAWLNVPPEYQHWYFLRLGLVSNQTAQDRCGKLLNEGFKKCPRDVHNVRFAEDGDKGINIMCPPQVHALMLEEERQEHLKWRGTFDASFAKQRVNHITDSFKERFGKSSVHATIHTSRGNEDSFKRDIDAVQRAV